MLSFTNPVVAVVLFAAVVPLVALPWTHHQYARFGQLRGWSALVAAAEVLYLCGLIAFTLFPLPEHNAKPCTGDFLTLNPLVDLAATPAAVAQIGLNVLLFVPLGLLLRYRWRRGALATAAVGLGVSLLVETTQGTAIFGLYACPYRVADVGDLIVNTAGTVLGGMLALATSRLLPAPEPQWVPDLAQPGLARRALAHGADLLIAFLGGSVTAIVLFFAGVEVSAVPLVVLATAVTTLLAPLVRRDRATLGQVTFLLAPEPARAVRSVLLRYAVWWLPVGVLAATDRLAVLLLLAVVAVLAARSRADRRSVLELVTGTTTVTRPTWDQMIGGSTPQPARPADPAASTASPAT
ncbi:VanZ family protein [Actinoplanes sp. NPDC049596]|uniref:VanZ family protein n=1 Tax=unclassified Actinoplanes TaxID=2626549 RepID=UPI0034290275